MTTHTVTIEGDEYEMGGEKGEPDQLLERAGYSPRDYVLVPVDEDNVLSPYESVDYDEYDEFHVFPREVLDA